jgi:hypothetical protein
MRIPIVAFNTVHEKVFTLNYRKFVSEEKNMVLNFSSFFLRVLGHTVFNWLNYAAI